MPHVTTNNDSNQVSFMCKCIFFSQKSVQFNPVSYPRMKSINRPNIKIKKNVEAKDEAISKLPA